MALYQTDSYAFDMFEARPQTSSEKSEGSSSGRLTKVPPKSKEQNRYENAVCRKKSAVLVFVFIFIFAMIAMQIYPNVQSNELLKQINSAKAEIKIAEAENIRLNSELNSITSIAKIDSYATDILGMNRVESYQVKYINLSQGDKVVYSFEKADLQH